MTPDDQDPIVQSMREHAERVFQKALRAVEPEEAVLRHVKVVEGRLRLGEASLPLHAFRRVLVVGAGKANAPMARALERILGERITGGVMVVKEAHGLPLQRIQVREASHPVPDERGLRGTEEVLAMVREAGEGDLIICLFSGGGSALLVAPAEGVTLEDKQEVTQFLLACGATIHEINAVRKHLSRSKGGGLARLGQPATVVSLILSDVVGDDLDVIASGPTVPDSSSFQEASQVLHRYGIWKRVPARVRERMERGLKGDLPETPKPGDPCFERCHWLLVGTNLQALLTAREEAERLGYGTVILSAGVEGETREVAKVHAAMAREVLRSGNPISPPACLLSGGETTVTLRGNGRGGRNQEFVLASALALEGLRHVVVLSGGTDGTDGPTDAAGAVADGETVSRARSMDLDPRAHLEQNDAYPLFHSLGDLLITGPTRTNVMDVRVFLVRAPSGT
jgi:hydroxypyruvate reductase